MASTNTTVNYGFGQFVGTDKPSWLTDYNGDMLKIDLAIKTIEDLASGTDTKVNNALADISVLNPYKNKVDALEVAIDLKADQSSPNISGILNLQDGRIKFPAVQVPSADANTLDDYEEGNWTPTINTTTKTYTTQYGNYTKIGNLVTVSFNLVFNNTESGIGDVEIGGLPFSVSNKNANLRASGIISYNNIGSSAYTLYAQSGLGYLLIATGSAFLIRSAIGVAPIVIMGTITYETL